MNFLKKFPIRMQLMILVIPTVLTVGLFIISTYVILSQVLTRQYNTFASQTADKIDRSISDNQNEIDHLMSIISYNPLIMKLYKAVGSEEKVQISKDIDYYFEFLTSSGKGVLDVVILYENGNYYSFQGSTQQLSMLELSSTDDSLVKYSGIETIGSTPCIIASRPLLSSDPMDHYGKKIATAYLVLDIQRLIPDLNSDQPKGVTNFYILDQKGKTFPNHVSSDTINLNEVIELYGKNTETLGSIQISGETHFIKVQYLSRMNCWLVGIIPEQGLISYLLNIRKLLLVAFILAALLLSIPFALIIHNLLSPLKKFRSFMASIQSGNLKSLKRRLELSGYTEIVTLSKEFNTMLDEIDDLTHRLLDTSSRLYQAEVDKKHSELEKREAELAFLQSQINPHFLYNTLESIRGLAAMRGAKDIKDITGSLVQVFKYSIKAPDIVTLKEELDIVKAYIFIQTTRFADRFSVEYDIAPCTLDCKVPKMMLQPLVENAVFHGLEPKLEPGVLKISGQITENRLLQISIRDNGIGINTEKLAVIQNQLKVFRSAKNGRIGIGNVNNRLKLFFGEEYGITLQSEPGIGTELTITVPIKEDSDV